jgi:hypothetical protein
MIAHSDANNSSMIDGSRKRPPTIFGVQSAMAMRTILGAVAMTAILVATDASAQGVNLTGRWQCVALCLGPPGSLAFITQNGWQLNVVSDAGVPSRAWVDYPGRIWIETAYQGAIYSPDGLTLQFDRGTIWQRAPEVAPPPLLRRR